jgi:predicted nucleotidyltransferase
MQVELETLFKSSVDLVLASALDRYLRDEILNSAMVQYVAA